MTSLVIVEHDNQTIRPATLNAVTAALQCSSELHLLVAGGNSKAAADAAAKISGVTKVLHVDSEGLAHGLAESMAAQVLSIAPAYSHIVFAATASGKNIAPRVAAITMPMIRPASRTSRKTMMSAPSMIYSAITTPLAVDS